MSKNMTTTGNIRVEDITFRGARQQKKVIEEIAERHGDTTDSTGSVTVPMSLTPEAVKTFYAEKIVETRDVNEKKIYTQTIRWIDECIETKKKLVALELKYQTTEESPDDI